MVRRVHAGRRWQSMAIHHRHDFQVLRPGFDHVEVEAAAEIAPTTANPSVKKCAKKASR